MLRPWQRVHAACTCSRPAPSGNCTGGGPPCRPPGPPAPPCRPAGGCCATVWEKNAEARNATNAREKKARSFIYPPRADSGFHASVDITPAGVYAVYLVVPFNREGFPHCHSVLASPSARRQQEQTTHVNKAIPRHDRRTYRSNRAVLVPVHHLARPAAG